MSTDRPVCARCSERIGFYERIYADYGDGEQVITGWLNLAVDRMPVALWHAVCGEPASPKP